MWYILGISMYKWMFKLIKDLGPQGAMQQAAKLGISPKSWKRLLNKAINRRIKKTYGGTKWSSRTSPSQKDWEMIHGKKYRGVRYGEIGGKKNRPIGGPELDAALDAQQLREFGETFYRTGKTATNVQKRAKRRSSIQRARSYFGSKLREY